MRWSRIGQRLTGFGKMEVFADIGRSGFQRVVETTGLEGTEERMGVGKQ